MSITNTIKCVSHPLFNLYEAIQHGGISLSTDKRPLLMAFNSKSMGVTLLIEAPTDPVNPGTIGTLYYNTQNKRIFFSDGTSYSLVGTVLGRNGINVISKVTGPPSAPEEGDQYLISPHPDRDWKPLKNFIAKYVNGKWSFVPPQAGLRVGIETEFIDYLYDGETWSRCSDTLWVQAIALEVTNG